MKEFLSLVWTERWLFSIGEYHHCILGTIKNVDLTLILQGALYGQFFHNQSFTHLLEGICNVFQSTS